MAKGALAKFLISRIQPRPLLSQRDAILLADAQKGVTGFNCLHHGTA
jgi:hypothetical protein